MVHMISQISGVADKSPVEQIRAESICTGKTCFEVERRRGKIIVISGGGWPSRVPFSFSDLITCILVFNVPIKFLSTCLLNSNS